MADIRYNLYNKAYSNQNNILLEIINELNQIRNSMNNSLLFKRIGDVMIKMNYLVNENKKNFELIRNDISKYFHLLDKKLDNKMDKMQINITNIKEIQFNDGKYVGRTVNNLAEGKGVFYYNNGERYEGEWKNDKREGKGIYYFKNGDRMMGDYINNRPIGKHAILTVDKEIKIEFFKEENAEKESSPYMKVIFIFTNQRQIELSIPKNKSVRDLRRMFFEKIGRLELFENKDIYFIYKGNHFFGFDNNEEIWRHFKDVNETIVIIVVDDKEIASKYIYN